MNLPPEYALWLEAGVVITLACTAVVFAALSAERLVASAVWRRTIWQASALGLVLVFAVEITGLGRGFGQLVCFGESKTVAGADDPSVTGDVKTLPTDSELPPTESKSWPADDGRQPAFVGIAENETAFGFSVGGVSLEDPSHFSEPSAETNVAGLSPFAPRADVLSPCEGRQSITPQSGSGQSPDRATAGTGEFKTRGRSSGNQFGGAGSTAPSMDVHSRSEVPLRIPFVPESPTRSQAVESAMWPAVVWGVGGLAWVGYVLSGQILLILFHRRCREVETKSVLSRVGRLVRRLRLSAPVRIVESSGLTTPVAFGTLRPTVVLPPGFTSEFEADEQEAMLAHELAHLAAGDPAWQQVVNLLCALLWWQPGVWVLRNRLRMASEAVADEASLLIPEGPQHLAACLVVLGRRLTDGPRMGWIPMTGDGYRSNLGRRVRRLLALEPRTWRVPGTTRSALAKGVIVLMLVVTMVFGTAWARPRAALAQGESTMMQLKVTWSRSLAAATLAALMGSFSGDTAADQPQLDEPGLTGTQVALFDDEREGEEREVRRAEEGEREREGDRPREGDREREGDRPREGDREREGDRPRDGDREREGDRPRDGDRPREGDREREGDRPRDGDREREGDRERDGDGRRRADLLRGELVELGNLIRGLRHELEELPDDADEKARAIQEEIEGAQREIRELESALREMRHGERERDGDREGDGERGMLLEKYNALVRAREEVMQHGRELTRAVENARREKNERAIRELEGELEKTKHRFQEVERELHKIREHVGDRDQPRPDRPRPDQPRPDGPPRGDLERRLHHLRVAAENLQAAGMPDQAEHLMQQAENLARELGHREGERPPEHHPDRPRGERPHPEHRDLPRPDRDGGDVGELHRQMGEMRRQMEEMRHVLKELVEREKSRER